MTWTELQACIQATAIQKGVISSNQSVVTLLTDSRLLKQTTGTVFFAIKGKQDGGEFIQSLYDQGVRLFVVQQSIDLERIPEASVSLVENSIEALQQVAIAHRKNQPATTIAITGSNGKTTVKEWLSKLLSKSFSVVKTPKSYNSQIGVPLSVWNLQPYHEIGVFEAGISRIGEMANLEPIIQPELGIFTNIGTAHAKGFEDLRQKVAEKSNLFVHAKAIICCRDHTHVYEELKMRFSDKVIDWSFTDQQATVFIARDKERISFTFDGKWHEFSVPHDFAVWLENTIHSLLAALYFNVSRAAIEDILPQLVPVSMRLSIKKGINNCYLIDDTYNNDLHGLEVAIDFLKRQQQRSRKTLILSELMDSGIENQALYKRVAELVQAAAIERVILVGKKAMEFQTEFSAKIETAETTESMLVSLPHFQNEMILIKGARVYSFERIVKKLEEKSHVTRLEVSFEALTYNLNQYRSIVKSPSKIMAMVKASAYGGGSAEIANLLQFHNIDYLGVAYTDEAIALRKNGIHTPIMVMSPEIQSFERLAENNIEPEVFSLEQLQAVAKLANPPTIHLKVETGMNRLGLQKEEWTGASFLLKENPQIKVAGIFTHLSSSDDSQQDVYSHKQVELYLKAYEILTKELSYKPLRHVVNSPGMVRFPEYHFDMVRLGIGLYGYDPSGKIELREVNKLVSYVSQVKTLEAGSSIGYGRAGTVDKPTKIAIVPIGYADGYDRRNSKGAGVMVWNGHRLPTIGNVCMDMTMLLVGNLSVRAGDEVEVFGEEISVVEMARRLETIPYEILTSVSQRVNRAYLSE